MSGRTPCVGATLAARSLDIIRAGQAPSGAFVASPTFSQYGYAWFRDGAFVAEGLDLVGELEPWRRGSMTGWRGWSWARRRGVERSIATARAGASRRADYLHCRYALDGRPADDDWPRSSRTARGSGRGACPPRPPWRSPPDAPSGRARPGRALPRRAVGHALLGRVGGVPGPGPRVPQAAMLAGLRAMEQIPAWPCAREVRRGADALETHLLDGTDAWTKSVAIRHVDGSLLWIAAPYGLVTPAHPRVAATLARVERELRSRRRRRVPLRDDTYYGGGSGCCSRAALGGATCAAARPVTVTARRARCMDRGAGHAGRRTARAGGDPRAPSRADRGVGAGVGRVGKARCCRSHATYLALRTELEQGVDGRG